MNWRIRRNCRWHVVSGLVRKYGLDGIGVELGVKEARFSTYLLENNPNLRMVGVDLCAPRPAIDRLGFESYEEWDWKAILDEQARNLSAVSDRFELMKMDTISAAEVFDDESIDFVFVDAEHTYEGVKADILAWEPKVRSGGIVCGHDYNKNRPDFAGVIRAADEFGPVNVESDAVWWRVKQ